MEARSDGHSRMPGLTNRDTERAVLDEFVAAVRAGQSRMLVVRGEPGVVGGHHGTPQPSGVHGASMSEPFAGFCHRR
jgi:hypothetical protein